MSDWYLFLFVPVATPLTLLHEEELAILTRTLAIYRKHHAQDDSFVRGLGGWYENRRKVYEREPSARIAERMREFEHLRWGRQEKISASATGRAPTEPDYNLADLVMVPER